MPRLSCWFIRASMIHLAAGMVLGGMLLVNKATPIAPAIWRLLPAHMELLLVGWTGQLIMGVGFWIFPRFWRSRGDERPAWLALGLLNAGVLLVALGPFTIWPASAILLGRAAEAGAAAAFVAHAWPRIKRAGVPNTAG